MNPKLSVIMPVYNEEQTLEEIVGKVLAVPIEKELIIIDDSSHDRSAEIADSIVGNFSPDQWNQRILHLRHEKNQGKGAAVRTGFAAAAGDILLIQDADLEYDPDDYQVLLEPIEKGVTRVVYGSRRLLKTNTQHSGVSFYIGGLMITWLTNLLYGSKLTDEPTCYKVFHRDSLEGIAIIENGFAWEPEISGKLLRRGHTIAEVPIRYYPRPVEAGKKINWKDGVYSLWTLVRYRFGNE